MKAVARSYFWWASLDKAVEELARSCSACQAIQAAPAAAPLLPWAWPDVPWKRIHVDFAGPFLGKMSFLIVDAHSKWPSCLLLHHDAQSMLCNPPSPIMDYWNSSFQITVRNLPRMSLQDS